jgi:hypothetical protein
MPTGQTDEKRSGSGAFARIGLEPWQDKSLGSQQAAESVASADWTRRAGRLTPTARRRRKPVHQLGAFTLICAVFGAATGCSGRSNFLTGGPTMGQMKTSLSHLEYENEQLKRTTAKLQRENRSLEDRLVQEQMDNGDLTARLDDARHLLRDRGLDSDVRVGSHRSGESVGGRAAVGDDVDRATAPDGTRSRRRKTPFAQISGGGDPVAPIGVEDQTDGEPSGSRGARERARRSGRRFDDDEPDHHSYYTGPKSWLPVANGSDDSMILVR